MEFQGIEVIDGNRQQQEKRYTTGNPSQITLVINIDHIDEPEINIVFELGAHLSLWMDLKPPSPLDKVAARLIIMAWNLANSTRWLLGHWSGVLAWQQQP